MKARIWIAAGAAALAASSNAWGWSQDTHRRLVLDAVDYMRTHPSTTRYAALAAWAQAGGTNVDTLAAVMGQGAYDVDDFADTYICGAITGDCQRAPVWSLLESIAQYTSYWHFQNHTRGRDAHGNDYGGYNYSQLTRSGDIDELAAGWLWNDHLDDGPGGMHGWFGDGTAYNTYGLTEAHYRVGSSSSPSMYQDFQNFPFQPIDNLAQYWWSRFLDAPTPQAIGYVLHATDLLQPHHTWTTSGNHHAGWETWVKDNYDSGAFNDAALVDAALADGTFTPCTGQAAPADLRALLTQGGDYAYAVGGIVLSSEAEEDRIATARRTIPHAIAMVVRVLDCAAPRVAAL